MEQQRLIKIIENKGASSKEETNELWDIVRTFPYFQTARLLLAKSFHDQSSIHFHNELKTASAYAIDRRALYRLINKSSEPSKLLKEEESNVFVLEATERVESNVNAGITENQFTISERIYKDDVAIPADKSFSSITEKAKEENPVNQNIEEPIDAKEKEVVKENKVIAPSPSAIDESATSNEEIIRKRLSEILSKNNADEKKITTDILAPNSSIDSEVSKPVEIIEKAEPEANVNIEENKPDIQPSLDDLPNQPHDVIEGLELETIIEENYLHELEKLPEITIPAPPEKNEEVELIKESKYLSFTEWLKEKSSNPTTFEVVIDEPLQTQNESHISEEKPVVKSLELINKFIATSPRIVPAKVEFYSPANMAKLSITDNEDIISETLARIYFDQGNYQKARSSYEKLSLLYPEKSASFAPLIEKIDNILKENHPETFRDQI